MNRRPTTGGLNKQFKSPLIQGRPTPPAQIRPPPPPPQPVANEENGNDEEDGTEEEMVPMPPPVKRVANPVLKVKDISKENDNGSPVIGKPKPKQASNLTDMPPPERPPMQRKPQEVQAVPEAIPAAARRRMSAINADAAPPPGIWKPKERVGKALFECGLLLYPDRHTEVNVEGSLFRREFTKKLTQNELGVREVIDFVEHFVADQTRLLFALTPSTLRSLDEEEVETFGEQQQQSFLRLLLGVDPCQQDIAEVLLGKLLDLADAKTTGFNASLVGVDLPFMIVSQFKWLEHIVKPDLMIRAFLDAINLDDRKAIGSELIAALPEIFSDAQHQAIVEKLQPFLRDKRAPFTADILDTFSNLNLEPEKVEELRLSVLDGLGEMKLEHIPTALKFILSTVTPDNAYDVVMTVRQKIEIDDDDYMADTASETQQSHFKLIFTELKSALLLNSCQMLNWTKMYTQPLPSGNLDEQQQMTFAIQPFDFTMLVILHAITFKKKALENVFRVRRRAGLLTDATIQNAFKRYHAVLGDHLRSVVAIADSCVRCPDTTISSFGRLVYTQVFSEFDNVCIRQDIVANLVTLVFSLPIGSTNCAMDILLDISEKRPELLVPFRVFVRNLLDVLDNLHLSDVRKLYRILVNLAFANSLALSDNERARFKDDLYMIIRKQLAFTGPENAKYRQFGVLAAAMLARGIGQMQKFRNDSQDQNGTDSTVDQPSSSSGVSNEITQLFHLVQRSVTSADPSKTRDVSSLGLFYDELSVLAKSGLLPLETINWLSESLVAQFSQHFLSDNYESPIKIDGLLFQENEYCLDASNVEESQSLTVFPLAAAGVLQPLRKQAADIYHLCPTFRLIAECCLALDNPIDVLKGQLISAVIFPTLKSIARCRRTMAVTLTEQYAICESLLALVNWIRELLSTFGADETPETRTFTLRRLHELVPLMVELEEWHKACPTWVPRFITSSVFHSQIGVQSKGRPAKAGKTGAKKSTTKAKKTSDQKASAAPTQTAKSQILQSQAATQAPTQQSSIITNYVVMAKFRVAFRELSLDALKLLTADDKNETYQHSSLLQMSASSGANSTISNIFTPAEALYLVEDLIDKLKYKLIKSGSKAFGAFAGSALSGQNSEIIHRNLDDKSLDDVISTVISLVSPMCNLVQGCYTMIDNAFQDSSDSGDGVIEKLEERAEWKAGVRLYGLIFDCLAMLLVNVPQIRPEMTSSLLAAIARVGQIEEDPRTPAPNSDYVVEAFKYLSKFSDRLPKLLIAHSYLRTMEAIYSLCNRKNPNRSSLSIKIHEICKSLLEDSWTDLELAPGTASCKVLGHIFQSFLVYGQFSLSDALEDFVSDALEELKTDGKLESSSYKAITRKNLSVFYEVMLAMLVRVAETAPSLTRDELGQSQQLSQPLAAKPQDAGYLSQRHHVIPDGQAFGHLEMLRAWEKLSVLFRDIIETVRPFHGSRDGRAMLVSAIKHGRAFLEIFAKRGMPLFDITFQSRQSMVREILSTVQKGTRTLHIICSESKASKEVSIIALVPRLKKTLEGFIFRVKQMLQQNNCLEGFIVGVLKSRNMRGEEISSQDPYKDEDEADGQDGEKPKKKGKKAAANKSGAKKSKKRGVPDDDEEAHEEDEDAEDDGDEDEEADEPTEDGSPDSDEYETVDSYHSSEASSNVRKRPHVKSKNSSKSSGKKGRHSLSTAFDNSKSFYQNMGDEDAEDECEENEDDEEETDSEQEDDDEEEDTYNDDDDNVTAEDDYDSDV